MKYFKCDECKTTEYKGCIIACDNIIDVDYCPEDGVDDSRFKEITKEEFLKEIE